MASEELLPKQKMSDAERAELCRKLDEDLDRFMDDLAARKVSQTSMFLLFVFSFILNIY